MFETGATQFRMAMSMVWGRRLDPRNVGRLIDDVLATVAEFGEPGDEAQELLGEPPGDPQARLEFTTRSLRRTARRLAAQSPFYARQFAAAQVEPGRLDLEKLAAIPVTTKQDLLERPGDFRCSDVAGLPPRSRPRHPNPPPSEAAARNGQHATGAPMPGMNTGPNVNDRAVTAAFKAALLHQGLIALLIFALLAVAWAGRRPWRPAAGRAAPGPAEPAGRRLLRIGFGLLWLLDGILQAQPKLAGGLPAPVIEPAAASSPPWVQHLVSWAAAAWTSHPVPAGASAVWILAGLGLFLAGMAVLQAWPGRGSWPGMSPGQPGPLATMTQSMSQTPQPGFLSAWVSAFAAFDEAHGFAVNVFAVVVLAVTGAAFLSGRPGLIRPVLSAFVMVCLDVWVLIQDLGFLGGLGTDPNSMIPFALLAAAGCLARTRVAAGPPAQPPDGMVIAKASAARR